MKKQSLPLAAALAASLLVAGCGNDKPAETAANAPSTVNPADSIAAHSGDTARTAKTVVVEGVPMSPDKNIVQNAANAPSVSTLVAAIKQADLAETLSGTGPFTVFAPTNTAFEKLPKGAVDALMKPESKAKLAGVLTYHVIQGRVLAADLKDGQELTTMNGAKLHISVKDGKVMISNGKDAAAAVQKSDIFSSNGVTHVIDGVVLPTI